MTYGHGSVMTANLGAVYESTVVGPSAARPEREDEYRDV